MTRGHTFKIKSSYSRALACSALVIIWYTVNPFIADLIKLQSASCNWTKFLVPVPESVTQSQNIVKADRNSSSRLQCFRDYTRRNFPKFHRGISSRAVTIKVNGWSTSWVGLLIIFAAVTRDKLLTGLQTDYKKKKKENASIFSFSHNVFYPIKTEITSWGTFIFSSAMTFNLSSVESFLVW